MIEFLLYLLIGTYTTGTSEGIYVYRFNTLTGESDYVSMAKAENPSYLVADPSDDFVYAVSENNDPSYANAFRFDKEKGELIFLNKQETQGASPCYISLNEDIEFVFTANYGGGSLSVFPINVDKSLNSLSRVFKFESEKDNPERKRAHLHCVQTSPDGNYIFAADLGNDQLYRFDIKKTEEKTFIDYQSLTSFPIAKGSGPRHFVFHPTHDWVYLINELSGTVCLFDYINGDLDLRQTIVADSLKARGSADIRISPDGRFLYASNRLKGDGIAIFSIADDGHLTSIGYQNTGIHPRNFVISPDGNLLLVACRDSNIIQVFSINKKTGLLTDLQKNISIDKPVCLQFVR